MTIVNTKVNILQLLLCVIALLTQSCCPTIALEFFDFKNYGKPSKDTIQTTFTDISHPSTTAIDVEVDTKIYDAGATDSAVESTHSEVDNMSANTSKTSAAINFLNIGNEKANSATVTPLTVLESTTTINSSSIKTESVKFLDLTNSASPQSSSINDAAVNASRTNRAGSMDHSNLTLTPLAASTSSTTQVKFLDLANHNRLPTTAEIVADDTTAATNASYPLVANNNIAAAVTNKSIGSNVNTISVPLDVGESVIPRTPAQENVVLTTAAESAAPVTTNGATSTTVSANSPKKATVLITGITGLIGSHVAREIVTNTAYKDKYTVVGLVRHRSNLQLLKGFLPYITFVVGDITDSYRIMDIVDETQPAMIFHFAGLSVQSVAQNHPELTQRVNVQGTLNILEGLRRAELFSTRLLFAGSSSEYGLETMLEYSVAGRPVPETAPLVPSTPYGTSKLAAERLVLQYAATYGLNAIVARLFLQIGQGASAGSVSAVGFCKQIAMIEAGLIEPTVHITAPEAGGMEVPQDVSYVKDTAVSLLRLVELGVTGESYNVGSGSSAVISPKEMLRTAISLSTYDAEISAVLDPSLETSSDTKLIVPSVVADIGKLTSTTGWTPRSPVSETMRDALRDTLSHLRGQVNYLFNKS